MNFSSYGYGDTNPDSALALKTNESQTLNKPSLLWRSGSNRHLPPNSQPDVAAALWSTRTIGSHETSPNVKINDMLMKI
jgi:hypothetical protein